MKGVYDLLRVEAQKNRKEIEVKKRPLTAPATAPVAADCFPENFWCLTAAGMATGAAISDAVWANGCKNGSCNSSLGGRLGQTVLRF
ncbi:hypothetical protein LIER_09904 [Lithospermum erythrorhizon]|uniref:Uncharacterized protein n=1 Tax=Lithospermum erythrorhizon TaxID=34254 RepID=A0AAV3PHB2_LITER